MTDDLPDRLAREATALRPEFSASLHDRVMAGMAPVPRTSARLRPVHVAWAAVAAAAAFVPLWVRPMKPQSAPIRVAFPHTPLRLRTPPIPDAPRELARALRRTTVAFLEVLEEAPFPIAFPEGKAKLSALAAPSNNYGD